MQFKKNDNNMIRNSRSPTVIVVGLLVIVLVLAYNYLVLSQKNELLRDTLFSDQEKLRQDNLSFLQQNIPIKLNQLKTVFF